MSWVITGREAGPADPFIGSVSLLLHGDGTNGSTTITDSSPSPKTVTVVGNAQISTAQSKFGGASIFFNGETNTSVTAPAGLDFAYGTADFTVECWFYSTELLTQSSGILFSQTRAGTNYFVAGLTATTSSNPNRLFFIFAASGGGTQVLNSNATFSLNTWNHYAVVRNNGLVAVYLNGVSGTPVSCTQNFNVTTFHTPTLGRYSHSDSLKFIGYIDDLRITKGVARYTANFTPPTAPFPDI